MEEVRSAPGKKWSGGKSRLWIVYHNQGSSFNVPQDSLPLPWKIVYPCPGRQGIPCTGGQISATSFTSYGLRITDHAFRTMSDLSPGTGLTCPTRH